VLSVTSFDNTLLIILPYNSQPVCAELLIPFFLPTQPNVHHPLTTQFWPAFVYVLITVIFGSQHTLPHKTLTQPDCVSFCLSMYV